MKKTLVLGATTNPDRYAYKAVHKLVEAGHEVVPFGIKNGEVAGIPIEKEQKVFEGIDTVTLYVGPDRQMPYLDYILSLKPKRVLFNPGTENPAFKLLLEQNGIETEEACTLVLLSLGAY